MNATLTADPAVAQMRLVSRDADHLEMSIPATNYRLRFAVTSPIRGEIGKRVPGIIRCDVWKVDVVSVGGDYIEPVIGKPRRVQGHVIGHTAEGIIVRVCGTPFLGILPAGYKLKPADLPPGSRVGMDIAGEPVFTPQ
ncbi:MAG: hypothetical protein ACYC26_09590 [Phycisphaerales bacterium]